MAFLKSIRRLLSQDWFLALILLGIYLATNRYVYAWDDQHLEIPLLKHLIDPTLYQGDYYVESLKENFTSYLYPMLARFITVAQIPAAYLILFLFSRFLMFYWSFKLWDLLARRYFGRDFLYSPKFAAFCAVVMSIVMGRTEEFLYRTFSHQEFAIGLIFAAIYYFFKDRFLLAAFIFGVAANFHALYALFPMTYMSVYLLFFHRDKSISRCVSTGLVFMIACLPFLMWAIPHNLDLHTKTPPDLTRDWVEMYYLACPQNYPFAKDRPAEVFSHLRLLVHYLNPFMMLGMLYIVHLLFNPQFRHDRKMHAVTLTVIGYTLLCFYLAYIHPMRFGLDLNLIRNEQYLRYLLMGLTTLFVVDRVRRGSGVEALVLSVSLMAVWFNGPLTTLVLGFCGLVLLLFNRREVLERWQGLTVIAFVIIILALMVLAFQGLDRAEIRLDKVACMAVALGLLVIYLLIETLCGQRFRQRAVFVTIPLTLAFLFFCYYHYQYVRITTKGGGFWQLQRNWEDMQRYVRDHTPKSAVILTPYNTEMGGFRILSERKELVSYRDCGIVGFDYRAAVEWRKRIADVEPFKVITDPKSIGPALVNALYKYKVDYIVFMRYYAPGDNPVVGKMYENEVFALYRVIRNNEPERRL